MSIAADVRNASSHDLRSLLRVGIRRIRGGAREAAVASRVRLRSAMVDRVLPNVLIIGAQKAGTTSLFDALARHRQVASPICKEVHYFDLNFGRGSRWYAAHFPSRREVEARQGQGDDPRIVLEASPYYLFHPAVPERVAGAIPDARFIVMLRDPIARTYSHYWHEWSRGFERLGIHDALDLEEQRLEGTSGRLCASPGARSYAHRHFSYVARSRYAEQIERWLEWFPRERFLFLQSEALFAAPERVMQRVLDFLGLPVDGRVVPRRRNMNSYPDTDATLRARLERIFEPHSRRLVDLLGTIPEGSGDRPAVWHGFHAENPPPAE